MYTANIFQNNVTSPNEMYGANEGKRRMLEIWKRFPAYPLHIGTFASFAENSYAYTIEFFLNICKKFCANYAHSPKHCANLKTRFHNDT